MKKIAIVFQNAPHGTAQGREALDLALASSALTDQLSLFFVGDAVLHLLPNQQPEAILMRDYIRTLGLLDVYDITERYVAIEALQRRGLALNSSWVIEVMPRSLSQIGELLAQADSVLTF